MRTFVLVLALLLVAPWSVAQILPEGPAPVDPTVEVTLGEVEGGASIDAPARYTVTTRNTSPGTTSGQDPPMDVSLEVSGVPSGWTASLDEAAFQIIAGEQTTTTLTVAVSGSATVDTAAITVTATIRNGGIGPLERTGTDMDTVDVLRDDTTRREVTEVIGDYLWIIVLGGIGLYIGSTILLVMLFRNRDKEGKGPKKSS